MANLAYTYGKSALMTGGIDLDTHDMRMLLVMSNTTADTEADKQFVSGFTTLDEMDGANYARKTLAGESVATDEANDRGEFTFTAPVWSALGNGSRAVVGAVLYKFVSADADSPVLAYFDLGTINPGGADLTLTPNAEGAVQVT